MSLSSPTRPRYAALAQEMAEQIARGHYPLGSQLPTELALSVERGVSRATVRAALERLEELGLVSRRRRSGTRVTATRAAPAAGGYMQSLSAIDDLLQYAAETERRILRVTRVVADDALAAQLGARPGSRWHRVSSLRISAREGTAPLCWTDTHADAAAAPADFARRLRGGDAGRRLIATLLAEWSGRPIVEVRQEIHAAGIPAGAVAAALRTEPDAHALRITRRYMDGAGTPLAVSTSWHPADRFAYAMRLKRSPET